MANRDLVIFELNQFFQKEIIEDNIALYTTIAGFFLNELKRIPQIGDTIQHDNFILEIIDLDGLRIDKISMKTSTTEE